MARRTGYALVLAALGAVLAGCGSEGKPDPPAPTTTKVLVEYIRTGGLRRRDHRLVIRPDGHVRLWRLAADPPPAWRFRVTKDMVVSVAELLDDAGFTGLPTNERTIPEPDGFDYVIRYRGHVVKRESAGLDPQLALAIGRLDAIVAARD